MGSREPLSLPLLAKELVELSARPRTYVVRVCYAAFLLLICWIVLRVNIPWTITSVLNFLGSGRVVLRSIDALQNLGLQLVLPALACGVFTVEKERNTLSLLFLTRLGPWTIIFEKLLSQMLLAGSFLMISFPVLAFGYAMGGITIDQLLATLLELAISAVVILSASLLCSAYFRTTSGALLGTYLIVLLTRAVFLVTFGGLPNVWMLAIYLIPGMSGLVGGAVMTPAGVGRLTGAAFAAIPWLAASTVYVLLARWFLVRRAFLQPYSPVREFLRKLDRFFEWANRNSWTQGRVVVRPRESVPDDDPVAWREVTKRGLGQFRYLFRILLVLELPVLGLLLDAWIRNDKAMIHTISIRAELVMWPVLAIVTCVVSAGLICGERGRQTLDVLLATPLIGREIVEQKMAGISRLIWVLEVPLWTCLLFRWQVGADWALVVSRAAMLLIYPRCIAWSSMWFGLRSRTTIAAVVKSLLMLVWKCVGILLVGYFLAVLLFYIRDYFGRELTERIFDLGTILCHLSPLPLFAFSEDADRYRQQIATGSGGFVLVQAEYAVVFYSIIQGSLWVWARWSCLHSADAQLRRSSKAPIMPDWLYKKLFTFTR